MQHSSFKYATQTSFGNRQDVVRVRVDLMPDVFVESLLLGHDFLTKEMYGPLLDFDGRISVSSTLWIAFLGGGHVNVLPGRLSVVTIGGDSEPKGMANAQSPVLFRDGLKSKARATSSLSTFSSSSCFD
nr:hypothetical protein CFP56_73512 [Quercus suber]